MKTKFDKLKAEFIKNLEGKNPCQPEYDRVLACTTEAELLQIRFNNIEWCLPRNVISHEFFSNFTQKTFITSGLANTGKENTGFINSGNSNSGAFCVDENMMSEQEKLNFPHYKTTGGYLKSISVKEGWANFWGNLSDSDKACFANLPHFDAEKFESITGIKIVK